jgi:hypothetical protein
VSLALLCGVGALISSFATGGGVWLRTAGIAVVNDRGEPVSRVTAVTRAALSWSWLVLLSVASSGGLAPPAIPILVVAVAWHAVLNPAAGSVDRLLGTRLVPR